MQGRATYKDGKEVSWGAFVELNILHNNMEGDLNDILHKIRWIKCKNTDKPKFDRQNCIQGYTNKKNKKFVGSITKGEWKY